jgi:predicted alpha/beta superfamily hydrolase
MRIKLLQISMRIISSVYIIIFASSETSFSQEINSISYSIGNYKTIFSIILNEKRTILVHLPDDYDISLKKYPVLYILDSENTNRFTQIVSAITFYSGIRRLPKMIVVGILNTDRTRDLTPQKIVQRKNSGGGEAFLDFIISEVKPYIEKNYRTSIYDILSGGSLAGTFTLYALFNKPESFDAYIASRPALNSTVNYTWDSNTYPNRASELLEDRPSLRKSLYIDYGRREDALHDPAVVHGLMNIFKSMAPKDFHWKVEGMDESGYRSSGSFVNGMISIFEEWYYPADSLFTHGFSNFEIHINKLSKLFGYPVTVADLLGEDDLLMFGNWFLENDKVKESILLFKSAISAYPNAWNLYDSIAEAYMVEGQIEAAIYNFEKSLELNPENTNAVLMLKKIK